MKTRVHWNGQQFSNELHARWAIFFTELGIEWEYKPNGFFVDGAFRIPAFRLRSFNGGMVVEVAERFDIYAVQRCYRLSEQGMLSVMMAEGLPDYKVVKYFEYNKRTGEAEQAEGLPNADQASDENRMFVFPGYEDDDGTIAEENYQCLGDLFVEAVNEARGFEFAEQ